MLIFQGHLLNASSLRMTASAALAMDAHTSRRKGGGRLRPAQIVYSRKSCLYQAGHLCPPTTTAAPDCPSPNPKPMEGEAAAVSSADFSTLVMASLAGEKVIFFCSLVDRLIIFYNFSFFSGAFIMAMIFLTAYLIYRNRRSIRGYVFGRRVGGEQLATSAFHVRDRRVRFYSWGSSCPV